MTYGAKQYKQTAVLTASRGQVLIMLYEAAIRNVKKATDCMQKKDMAGKGEAIGKTHDILNELMNSLDFQVGGDIARELERLYNFMIEQLVKANADNDQTALTNIHKLLNTLLDGWRGAVREVERGASK